MAVSHFIGTQAAEYARHGWPLVLLPPRSKGERGMRKHWNTREHAVTDPEQVAAWHGNVGLLLAFARIASIDIDNLDAARAWFMVQGVDLDAMLDAPDALRIESGREGRAKLLYALPPAFHADEFLTRRILGALGHDRNVILELRCAGHGGVSMQDVLPPSVHPDTGQPYRWRGDWRNPPELPADVASLWLHHAAAERAHDRQRGPREALGAGTGEAFRDVCDRLERAGCKPFTIAPGDVRAHCPNHGGKSGTTLHVNESASGRVLLYCHAGCTWQEVFAALDMGPGPEVHMGAKASRNAPEADDPPAAPSPAPGLPAALCALPGRLGAVQDWIASTMTKPHMGVAGVTAFALVDFLALERARIASRDGLAMGEFFLILAPSAFGKERLRKPFLQLRGLMQDPMRLPLSLPALAFNAPSSQQGLQKMLIDSRCTAMLPDEFGDWIAKSEKEPHREQAMAHLMQVYGNPFGVVEVPHAITHPMESVRNPRLLLFGTSTAQRFSEVINGSHADRGFLNRFVIAPVGDDALELVDDDDDADKYRLPAVLVQLAREIAMREHVVTFDADAAEYRRAHVRAVLDPLATRDNRLAGRLNEQAIRMAAALALADGRHVIDVRDMATAYEIREALYQRTADIFAADAVLSADNPTMRALTQVRELMKRHASLTRARVRDYSRQFRRLGVREQGDVIRTLTIEGIAYEKDGRVYSRVCTADDADA